MKIPANSTFFQILLFSSTELEILRTVPTYVSVWTFYSCVNKSLCEVLSMFDFSFLLSKKFWISDSHKLSENHEDLSSSEEYFNIMKLCTYYI